MSERGWRLFWRASKRCWILSYKSLDGWAQKLLPREIARDEGPRRKAKKPQTELPVSRAEVWAAEWLGNAEALKLRPRARPGGLVLRDAFHQWKRLREGDGGRTSPATLRRFSSDVANIVRAFKDGKVERSIGDEDVVSLVTDYSLIRRWFRAVVARHSAWRARSAFSTLRSFWDDALVEKWVRGENPMSNQALVRELPALPNKADRGGIVLFELGDLQALIDHPRVPLGRATRYALAATTGNREGELSGLTWHAIHLDASIPHLDVVRARRLVRAKDEVLGPLKTATSRGIIPLHPAAAAALREWRDDRDGGVALLLGRRPLPSDPVFPSERPRDEGAFSRPRSAEKLREDLVAAELSPTDAKGRNLTMHTARKSIGTWLRRAKVAEPVRKAIMRHGANDVTEDFYTENLPEMADAISKIPLKWNLVPRFVPGEVPAGTTVGPNPSSSLAPPARVELATNALGKREPATEDGASEERHSVQVEVRGVQDSARTEDSGSSSCGSVAAGTIRSAEAAAATSDPPSADCESPAHTHRGRPGLYLEIANGAPRDDAHRTSTAETGGTGSEAPRVGDGREGERRGALEGDASASPPSPHPGLPGLARAAVGAVGARVEVDGRTIAATDVLEGEPLADVEARLKLAVGQRGGLR